MEDVPRAWSPEPMWETLMQFLASGVGLLEDDDQAADDS